MAQQRVQRQARTREDDTAEDAATVGAPAKNGELEEDVACCLADIDCCLAEVEAEKQETERDQALREFRELKETGAGEYHFSAWQARYAHLGLSLDYSCCQTRLVENGEYIQ